MHVKSSDSDRAWHLAANTDALSGRSMPYRKALLYEADFQPQKFVHLPHPLTITPSKVVIDCHNLEQETGPSHVCPYGGTACGVVADQLKSLSCQQRLFHMHAVVTRNAQACCSCLHSMGLCVVEIGSVHCTMKHMLDMQKTPEAWTNIFRRHPKLGLWVWQLWMC